MRLTWLRSTGLAALLCVLPTNLAQAQSAAAPCTIEEAKLTCGDGSLEGQALIAAFADAETQSYLQGLRYGGGIYTSRPQREDFRRSLERINSAMNKTVRSALRERKRRRMTEEAFEALKQQYAQARRSYELAINLYREGEWFSDRFK
ncbi:MAG: hypothetical protein AAF903_12685 [Pseudomonadota bacterium]